MRELLPGAIVGGIAVHLAIIGFSVYLGLMAGFEEIYGALGGLFGFLFLVYLVSSAIVSAPRSSRPGPRLRALASTTRRRSRSASAWSASCGGSSARRGILPGASTPRTAERRRERSRPPLAPEDHIGRRRPVHVAWSVDASAGSLRVLLADRGHREARGPEGGPDVRFRVEVLPVQLAEGVTVRGRVSSILVSHVRALGIDDTADHEVVSGRFTRDDGVGDGEFHHRVGVEVEDEPSGGPKPLATSDIVSRSSLGAR